MSGTTIRVIDLPDLGSVTDASSIVADKSGTGRFSALSMKAYFSVTTLPEAPSDNSSYGRRNGAWSPVLTDAPVTTVSFGRRNGTWSAVTEEAPLTGSTYGRVSGTWVPVLPITGGSIAGSVSVSGNITAGAGVYTNTLNLSGANGYAWAFVVASGSNNQIQQRAPGYYDLWENSTAAWRWGVPAGNAMSLTPDGNLVTLGAITGTQHWVAGTGNTFGLSLGGSGRILQFNTSFYLDYTPSGPTAGTLQYVDAGGPLWVMRASDHFCFNPQSNVGGNGAYLNISDRRAKTGITPTTRGLAEVLQLVPVEFDRVNAATGSQHEIGFVAQDVQPIVPEAVWQAAIPLKDGTGGYGSAEPTLAISEAALMACNVNAIKQLNDIITALTARVAALEAP